MAGSSQHRRRSRKRGAILPYRECLSDCPITPLLDGLAVGLVLMNPSGRVVWINRTAAAIFGVSKDDCLGRPLGTVLRDPQLAAFWHDASRSDASTLRAVSVQWPRNFELKVNCVRCVSEDGRRIGRALVCCDLTQELAIQVELSQAVASRLLRLAGGSTEINPSEGTLTAQELRVLRLLGEGRGNLDIAEELAISPSTVRSHLKSIYRKLGLTSRGEAVRYAVNHCSS